MPKAEIRLDLNALGSIHRAAQDAALEAMGALRTEIVSARVTPRDQGYLEDSGGAVDQFGEGDEVHTALCIGDEPYARRLYFHPEYNFRDDRNDSAQGRWAEHWLEGGDRENFVPDTFSERMKERLK